MTDEKRAAALAQQIIGFLDDERPGVAIQAISDALSRAIFLSASRSEDKEQVRAAALSLSYMACSAITDDLQDQTGIDLSEDIKTLRSQADFFEDELKFLTGKSGH